LCLLSTENKMFHLGDNRTISNSTVGIVDLHLQ
jgi:hypothetical protein